VIEMKRTNRKNKGVSTIIAAALLVAMTVIIAVALGSTVLSAPTAQKQPQLQMDGWASEGTNEIRLTHLGGDPINTGAVTFKTYIPGGSYEDKMHEIPNNVPGYAGQEAGWNQPEPTYDIPMRLETDPYDVQVDYSAYGMGVVYGYDYLTDVGFYEAPIQAGDTLVIDFDKSFGTFQVAGTTYDAVPDIGEQFVVEIYQDSVPFTAVTITVQP
jgi:flagellin-like protein